MHPKILLFDIDGTLIHTGGGGKAALMRALMVTFGLTSPDVEVSFAGRTDLGIARELCLKNGINPQTKCFSDLLDEYLRQLPRCIAELPGYVLPGVLALLTKLAARTDVMLGLLTGNIKHGAKIKLDHHGLSHFFSFGGYGDNQEDRRKIGEEALEEARNRLSSQVDPARVLVIGDTQHDVACAHHVGARCLAVATGVVAAQELAQSSPAFLVHDLTRTDEILAIIDRL